MIHGNGQGAGWIRLTAQQGSLINQNGVAILAANSHLIVKARDTIGSAAAPVLTQVKTLTAVTDEDGTGEIYILEADDLLLVKQGSYVTPQDQGLQLQADSVELFTWRADISWDDTISETWRNEVFDGNDVHAMHAGTGDITIQLLGEDARMTLQSGDIVAAEAGANINIIADDLDFFSGEQQVRGDGELN